jgi:hypothetical protein
MEEFKEVIHSPENDKDGDISPEEREVLTVNNERVNSAIEETNILISRIDATLKDTSKNDSTETSQENRELILVRDEVKTLRNKFAEGVYMFTRLAILAGATINIMGDQPFDNGKFKNREQAKIELRESGVTQYQSRAYKLGVSEILGRGITPYSYDKSKKKEAFISNLIHGQTIDKNAYSLLKEGVVTAEREDAWRLYLGLPQEHGTFGISDYKPTRGKDDVYYYKINNFFENAAMKAGMPLSAFIKELKDLEPDKDDDLGSAAAAASDGDEAPPPLTREFEISGDDLAGVMGWYTYSFGHDERGSYISYYDKWDLNIGPEKNGGFFGKPYEIYDRIYFNPKTFEPISVAQSEK